MPPTTDPGFDKAAKIQQVFGDLNRRFEEQDTQRKAQALSLPYFDLRGFPIEEEALATLGEEEATTALAIPFFKEGPAVKLGIAEPSNLELNKLLQTLQKKKYQLEVYLVSKGSLLEALKQYRKILRAAPAISHEMLISTGRETLEELKNLPNLGEELSSLPASQLLNLIIGAAITMNSSDIHLEPEKKWLKIRFRVDGVLQDVVNLPLGVLHFLLSRIKLLSSLKLNVTSMPQDGRFSVKWKDRNLDLRVSVLPSAFGESVVMRILGIQEAGFEIEELGLRGKGVAIIYQELQKPNGMILTTGPTGSGKTTTLYAFLNHLNKPGVKIITLEDPVEYELAGIIQTPIDHKSGMSFAKGLRSTLRQDPDIVMVGEIRDFETAETAAQAALTGHVVLSTLHTNDAAGAIPRLLDLGVKPVTLAPALTALVAQRLLRKICRNCKEIYRPSFEELERVRQILASISAKSAVEISKRLVFYHSTGCAQCHNLGYQGRIGVFEVLEVDEKMQELIYKQASTHEIKRQALEQGMLTMQQDGILKALEGITDLAEVWRVTEE